MQLLAWLAAGCCSFPNLSAKPRQQQSIGIGVCLLKLALYAVVVYGCVCVLLYRSTTVCLCAPTLTSRRATPRATPQWSTSHQAVSASAQQASKSVDMGC